MMLRQLLEDSRIAEFKYVQVIQMCTCCKKIAQRAIQQNINSRISTSIPNYRFSCHKFVYAVRDNDEIDLPQTSIGETFLRAVSTQPCVWPIEPTAGTCFCEGIGIHLPPMCVDCIWREAKRTWFLMHSVCQGC